MTRRCPGPIPPGRPRLSAPRGACDVHAHVLGPYDRFPLAAERSYTVPQATAQDCRGLMQALGLDRVVIVHPSGHGMDLSVTYDALASLGTDRARAVGVVDPDVNDATLEDMHAAGFRGVRMQTMMRGGVDPSGVGRLAARVAPLGWHVELMLDGPRQVAETVPLLHDLAAEVVIDHMGCFRPSEGADHPAFQALVALVREGRTWIKLSAPHRRSAEGPPCRDMVPFAARLIEARPDRMLWGTDWPHVATFDHPIPDDASLLDWALEWPVDEATRNAILVDNPARLYGFGPTP